MNGIHEIVKELERFNKTEEGHALDLRLDLAEIILRGLSKPGSHAKLAAAAKMKPSFLSRITHADANCTFDVASRIISAIGLRARLVAVNDEGNVVFAPYASIACPSYSTKNTTYGETKIQNVGTTETEQRITAEREIAGTSFVVCSASTR